MVAVGTELSQQLVKADQRNRDVELMVFDSCEGKKLASFKLYTTGESSLNRTECQVANRVVITKEDKQKLAIVVVPEELIKNLKTPLCLKAPDTIFADLSKDIRLKFSCVNDVPAKYSIDTDSSWIQIDTSSGELTIDHREVMKLLNQSVEKPTTFQRGVQVDHVVWPQNVRGSQNRSFVEIPDGKVGFNLSFQVRAEGADGQRSARNVNLILLVPETMNSQWVKKRMEKIEEQRRVQQELRNQMRNRERGPQLSRAQSRIRSYKREIDRIEKSLKAILELLEKSR